MHPHSDACVRTVLPRSCIYVFPCLQGDGTGCTKHCFGAWEMAMHHAREALAQAFGANAPKQRCLCAICAKQAMHLRVLLPCRESEQATPSDALVPGSWQCTTHAEAVAQAFGANASKRPCLCAICAKQAMHLRVLSPTERVNRLHHATLCRLGGGSAIHTQLYVILSDSPSRAYCIHTAMPVCNLCFLGNASMCPLAS